MFFAAFAFAHRQKIGYYSERTFGLRAEKNVFASSLAVGRRSRHLARYAHFLGFRLPASMLYDANQRQVSMDLELATQVRANFTGAEVLIVPHSSILRVF